MISMLAMLGTYALAMPLASVTSGPDTFLMMGIAPAAVIFIQFYRMISISQKFRADFAPHMDYVDFLMMEFGDAALRERYQGVLIALDLGGYKRLSSLKRKSQVHVNAVNTYMATVQHDLQQLASKGSTIFRYKSNGDEWIYLLYGATRNSCDEMILRFLHQWKSHGASLRTRWRTKFCAALGEHIDAEDLATLDSIDIHAMVSYLDDIFINVENRQKRADFTSDRFTMLSPGFKHSTGGRLAMYKNEAFAYAQTLGWETRIYDVEGYPDLCLLEIPFDAPKSQVHSALSIFRRAS